MNDNGIIPLDFVEAVMHGYRKQPWCKNVYYLGEKVLASALKGK